MEDATLRRLSRLAHFARLQRASGNPLGYLISRALLRWRYKWKRLSGRIVVPYDKGLINVDISTKMGYRIAFQGYYDPEQAAAMVRLIRPGDVCIDIGANIGAHTLIMGFAAGPTGKVVAVEPHPEVAARLLDNVALNRLKNVSVIQAALTGEDGETSFFSFRPDAKSRVCASLKRGELQTEEMRVPSISGRRLEELADLKRCDLIKIDTVGADMLVVGEIAPLIDRYRPHLFVEYRRGTWDNFGYTIADARHFFGQRDYCLYVIKDHLTRPLPSEVPEPSNLLCVPRGEAELMPE